MANPRVIPLSRDRSMTVRRSDEGVDPALATEAADAIEELEDVVIDVQQTLAEQAPDGDPKATVKEVALIVDGPKQRAAQDAAHRAVAKLDRAKRRRH